MRRFLLSVLRLSWPVQGLLVCAALLAVGFAVVDDYGVGGDEHAQRHRAEEFLPYIKGDTALPSDHTKFYGVAFELLMLQIERRLGLEDPRNVWLMRHLVMHLFFLAGGFCGSLLVYRLFDRKGFALVALLLFVLQPRLYANSFFNSKDIPFLSMFMASLYLTHRAFLKNTVRAFLLCGVSVGILTNLRIMGVMLFPAILALRGLDLIQGSPGQRKQVLATGLVFALAGPCTLYVLSPYLWTNLLEFWTAVQTLSHHPAIHSELFQGRLVRSNNLPPHFILTWIVISMSPVTLLSGALGVIVVAVRSIREPRAAVGNTDLRFGLLLVACLTLPVVAIVVLGSHVYEHWRHVFFLHAPLCSLGMFGLHWTEGTLESKRLKGGGCVLTGIGLMVTIVEMVQIHPHQHAYFNFLVDRTTPEYLRTRYQIDPEMNACREGLEFLRRRYPDTSVYVQNSTPIKDCWITLPMEDRARLILVEKGADFRIFCGKMFWKEPTASLSDVVHVHKMYNNTISTVAAMVTVPEKDLRFLHRIDDYRDVVSGQLVKQAVFDLYTYPDSRTLGYAKDGCTISDLWAKFLLHVYPVDERDLPEIRRQYGFDNLDFTFFSWGRWIDEQCWATIILPDYPISSIRTGQYTWQGRVWETDLVLPDCPSTRCRKAALGP